MSRTLTLLCGALALFAGATAPARSQPTPGACPSGNLNIIRTSKLKSDASLAGFQKAVADHAKWYADHGYSNDRIMAATVLAYDKTTNTAAPAPGMMMTLHLHATDVPPAKHDAAWAAYVAEYNASSDIVSTTISCVTP